MKKTTFLLFITLWLTWPGCMAYDHEHEGIYYNLHKAPALSAEQLATLKHIAKFGGEFSEGGTHAAVTYVTMDNKLYLSPYAGSVTVPDTVYYEGTAYPVTVVGKGAFANCKDLTEVILPPGICEIELGAFGNCEGLTAITLPDSLYRIGEMAFYNCKNLQSIQGGKNLMEIKGSAFHNCTSLGKDAIDRLEQIRNNNWDAYLAERILEVPDQFAEFSINRDEYADLMKENRAYLSLTDSKDTDIHIWLLANFQWPKELNKKKVKGRATASFVIEKDGTVTNVEVLKSPHPRLSEELVRLFNAMPKWEPAKHKGRLVRQRWVMPFFFN